MKRNIDNHKGRRRLIFGFKYRSGRSLKRLRHDRLRYRYDYTNRGGIRAIMRSKTLELKWWQVDRETVKVGIKRYFK